MRILEVESVYPSPVVGEAVLLRTKAYRVGQAGVKSLEYSSRNGFVIVTGTKATVEVPVAWLRLGEPVAEVKPTDPLTGPAKDAAFIASELSKGKRGKR